MVGRNLSVIDMCKYICDCRLDDQMYTYVVFPDGSERVILDLRKGYKNGFYFPPFGMAGQPGWKHNPYRDQRVNAPFDKVLRRPFIPRIMASRSFSQNFFLVMNVAVGGQNGNAGFWSQAPWMNCWPPDCYKVLYGDIGVTKSS
jgi:hypothetical protein